MAKRARLTAADPRGRRARGMADVAREAGVTRASLYKALSENGDPQLTTLLGVMKALGLKLTVAEA